MILYQLIVRLLLFDQAILPDMEAFAVKSLCCAANSDAGSDRRRSSNSEKSRNETIKRKLRYVKKQ
jgi:hypothetical protein